MNLIQMVILALVQGAAELLPISSSAHVIVAERWMGLDPSSPEMTFFLVMLHTGTMFAVILYFWPRWRKLPISFWKAALLATGVTGVFGWTLKEFIEKVILGHLMGESLPEIEQIFKSLPLIAASLFGVGILILFAGFNEKKGARRALNLMTAAKMGAIQGLCLPFRGFSRSGATISVALLSGVKRSLAEDFSFACAVLLTPPVIVREYYRLHHSLSASGTQTMHLAAHFLPGFLGMFFSFLSGLLALQLLSAGLEHGHWKYFGVYCLAASVLVLVTHCVLV